MTQTTLRSFLQERHDGCFAFRDRVVSAQDIVNHYSVYLDVQVATDGSSAFFVTSSGVRPTPFVRVSVC